MMAIGRYLSSLVFAASLVTISSVFAADRPNVVLIMTDNHGAWTLGCYGNRDIRTPHIDRLASEGTLFTRAFASNPVCSPTRATFLTGLIPSQHGVHSFLAGGRLQVGPNARCTLDTLTSIPEVLDQAGYRCGLVGKWHLGDNLRPQEGLDDYWITMPHGGTSTFYNAPIIEDGKIRNEPKYLTDLWTEHAVRFIDREAESEDPFFLFLAYNGPYSLSRLLLRDGRNRHAEYYADKPLTSFPRQPPHPWQLNNRDFINNPTSIRRVATEVSGVDDGVGAVMASLKANGVDDNTVVIFVADQGWVGGHGGFFGMGDHTRPLTARDGMMQIPTIWRHPGHIQAKTRSKKLISNYDFMPTLLGHLGLGDRMPNSPPSPGIDYSDVLTGNGDKQPRDAVFYEFENLRCVRTETHKLVRRFPNGPDELYDLVHDPDEFVNLIDDNGSRPIRNQLRDRLDRFFDSYAEPKFDMWNGGTSQVRIHDGIDEEMAQLAAVESPPLPKDFQEADIQVPEGFSVELVAGPPLVSHPTMGCFDDRGRLYVCNNAGVNRTNEQLEEELPNSIVQLSDLDGDGKFDRSTVFADKMTFPMGGTWLGDSLYVASPPNIWRLRDVDDDGIADEREIIVTRFGYNGNAASIHGCFSGPDGRLYWTDGYHGHEFKDGNGQVISKREGSYLFSCRPDGSDKRIHCGGGMDNPVEVDFTAGGDMLGTVNILYTRPRVDALVHWLYGGAYPHREKVLSEIKVTGDLLEPVHRFGHVAVSGLTRYRSGAIDHQWSDNLFATFFNQGKVVRLETQPEGSTYNVVQHEFLSSTSREFHPTDVLEDADGSLLVIDTGGWFYRGCPTSQFSKPELLGAIYRVRRDGMTPLVDPRGSQIAFGSRSNAELIKLFNDTRFAVRSRAVEECERRGKPASGSIRSMVSRADIRVRLGCVRVLTRWSQRPELAAESAEALLSALSDRVPDIRQAACRGLAECVAPVDPKLLTPLLKDPDARVRRTAAEALGRLGDAKAIAPLLAAVENAVDRSEEHALTYALIEIGDVEAIRHAAAKLTGHEFAAMIAIDQIDPAKIKPQEVLDALTSDEPSLRQLALQIAIRHPEWDRQIESWISGQINEKREAESAVVETLLARHASDDRFGALIGMGLRDSSQETRTLVTNAIARAVNAKPHPSWKQPLIQALQDSDADGVNATLAAVDRIQGDTYVDQLNTITSDPSRPGSVRLTALRISIRRAGAVNEKQYSYLKDLFENSPQTGANAASILGSSPLTSAQLLESSQLLRNAGPDQLRSILPAFGRTRDPKVIQSFLDAMGSASALLTLAEHELSDVVKRYPPATLAHANQLLDRIRGHQQQKRLKLDRLRSIVRSGDATAGEAIFRSEKAKCSTCHRVGEHGKRVGPDLTTIGANRSADDLLESIVFPSASIVRDYNTYKVLTTDGRALTGTIASESNAAYVIQQASGEATTISRENVDSISPSAVSIMPSGLDDALTESQVADVVAYLLKLQP